MATNRILFSIVGSPMACFYLLPSGQGRHTGYGWLADATEVMAAAWRASIKTNANFLSILIYLLGENNQWQILVAA
jgi:hypothetical protein